MYYNLLKRYGYVVENANGAKFFHGSNSASLVSLTKKQGLIPTGRLLKQGIVPFSGELFVGIHGVNQDNLSVTTFNYLDLALQNAKKSDDYTPEVSRKQIEEFKKFENSKDQFLVRAAATRIKLEQTKG
jgi:hypothetical protein